MMNKMVVVVVKLGVQIISGWRSKFVNNQYLINFLAVKLLRLKCIQFEQTS